MVWGMLFGMAAGVVLGAITGRMGPVAAHGADVRHDAGPGVRPLEVAGGAHGPAGVRGLYNPFASSIL